MKKNILYFAIGLTIGLSSLYLFLDRFNFKFKVSKLAKDEWNKFGNQSYDENGVKIITGQAETSNQLSKRIRTYWNEGTGFNYDGNDTSVAWSATFISWIMKKSGAGKDFKYSANHSDYIRDSIDNRKKGNTSKPFVGYKIDEYAPSIGDLICYTRNSNVNYDTKTKYASHCDIVVGVRPNRIDVIGGNVGDSVSKATYKTNSRGLLFNNSKPFFTVIKNNL